MLWVSAAGPVDPANGMVVNIKWIDDVLQERIVAEAMAGKSVLGILPTGTGKSVCYQVPAILRPGRLDVKIKIERPDAEAAQDIFSKYLTEGLPVPPADRVFEGQFNIPFDASSFPPAAEDPAQQLTYRAVVAFSRACVTAGSRERTDSISQTQAAQCNPCTARSTVQPSVTGQRQPRRGSVRP